MEVDREAMRQHCEALQAEFLADRALIIAANRAPVTLDRDEEGTLRSSGAAAGW